VWQSFDYPEFAIIPTQKFRFAHFLWHWSQTFRHDQSPYASCLFPGVGRTKGRAVRWLWAQLSNGKESVKTAI
jgi:hypothetical protein